MNETLREAKRLYDMGFAILLLHPRAKNPKGTGWTTGPRQTWKQIKEQYQEGDNIGVRTGEPSKIGKYYLACIDVDVKDPGFKAQALERLKELVGGLACPTVISGAGSGSRHIYCLTEKPFKMITDVKEKGKWEICIYSSGRQMVLPPSIHPSGRAYRWKKEFNVSDLPVIDFTEIAEREVNDLKPNMSGAYHEKLQPVDIEWIPEISEKTRRAIVSYEGVEDGSDSILFITKDLLKAGLEVPEILWVLTNPNYAISQVARRHRGGSLASQIDWLVKYTLPRAREEADFKSIFSVEAQDRELSAEEEAEQTEGIMEERNWRQDLTKTQYGGVKVTLRNLDLILSNSIPAPLFKKDMFANRIIYGVNTPWGSKSGDYIQDIDLVLIKHWLGTGEFGIEPSKEALFEVTDLIAHRERVHPVREWLESLVWDGKPRIRSWLRKYCKAEAEEPYLSEVSERFLFSMVKRVFHPGCQCDYTLVLEGQQGKYKSSIARALASDKWFMDNLPDLRDKDAMLNLQGKWLIELGELTNVKRSDFNLVKQYLVRRIDTVRPHYGRVMSDVPRQSVFIGTVNEGHYLKDPTGNRRFWPVKVGECDVKGLLKVRDQLFAEAFAKYQNQELMLTPEATAQAIEAQDDRRVEDENTMMEQALLEYMDSPAGKEFNWARFKIKDLFVGAPWGSFSDRRNYSFQIGSDILRKQGYERVKIKGQRIWRKPTQEGAGVSSNSNFTNGARGRGLGHTKAETLPPDVSEENFY